MSLVKRFCLLFLATLYFQLTAQIPNQPIKIIDYHVHIFSEEWLENAEDQGYNFKESNFQIINENPADYQNIEKILKDNETIKMLLVSAGYSFLDQEKQSEKREHRWVKKENNLLHQIVQTAPGRLIGFYGVNPLKSFTMTEIKRCHTELGLDGIKLHLQGNNIDLENGDHLRKIKEIFDYASKENIPLLIHNNAWDLSAGKKHAEILIDSILTTYESLTIIFAHGGGGGG